MAEQNGHEDAKKSADTAEGVKLTKGGKKQIGNLESFKDVTAAEAIRQRGGGQSQVDQLQTGFAQMKIGDLANLAAQGDAAAKTAMKIIKQASLKAQKYGGK